MTDEAKAVPRKNLLPLMAISVLAIGVIGFVVWPGGFGRGPCSGDEGSATYSLTVNESGGNALTLRRSKNWYNAGLGAGKWIGTAANGGPGASEAYPTLEPSQKGCVKFKYPGGMNSESAKLHVGTGVTPLKFALYCVHADNHPSDIKPKYEAVPDVCDKLVYRLETTVGLKVDSLEFAPLGILTLAARLDSLRSKLAVSGVPQQEAMSLTTMVGQFGPWYPCASAGCCRAWGS